MAKHADWTRRKHRSHVNGRRFRPKNLQERLDHQVERLRRQYVDSSSVITTPKEEEKK